MARRGARRRSPHLVLERMDQLLQVLILAIDLFQFGLQLDDFALFSLSVVLLGQPVLFPTSLRRVSDACIAMCTM
jgi:hypothetical protein